MQRSVDRLSVEITVARAFDIAKVKGCYSHCTADESNEYLERIEDDVHQAQDDSIISEDTQRTVSEEVADWLESQECNEFWKAGLRQPRLVIPSARQLARHIKTSTTLQVTPCSGRISFEALLHLIALELLATCYTSSSGSIASCVPLLERCKDTKPTTALRAYSKSLFSPAFGHHTRPSSEIGSFPCLSMGLSLKDKIAEHDSRRRRQQNDQEQHVLDRSGTDWTDGPPPEAMRIGPDRKLSKASSRSSAGHKPGFFSQLICQKWAELKPRQHDDQTPSLENIDARPIQRMPFITYLCPTQSAPSVAVQEDVSIQNPYTSRRCSSDPSDGTLLTHRLQIPEIQRISESTDGSQSQGSSTADSLHACERGDLIVAHDHFVDTPDGPYTARQQQNQWKNLRWRHIDTIFLSPPAAFLTAKPTQSSQIVSQSDYFGHVHIGRRTTDEKEEHGIAATGNHGIHSTINDSIEAQFPIEELGGSDRLNQKKPRGVSESSRPGCEFRRPSRGKIREELDHYSAKVGW
ncbi:hypothetical protein COCMIDRAFT_88529 [Bipolaris oryzae ATCC 44560]|uniref:Uncharacterized protein n=1 Tax=Bipolaris oryzae ATCC 44560 TaxID=930090 RepID=W6ZKE8_COCMI|nr:uncharacterized protein COCMIDRAFT_88529 [Bipolaris oryzae ATCC 44560]EUC47944.1 hypothetical protein COCMIDRAFT_88529 [Bipolaris oryzae ATCC 44560]